VTVAADAGMISDANTKDIEASGLSFILGMKVQGRESGRRAGAGEAEPVHPARRRVQELPKSPGAPKAGG
jgi:hypothetical protein